MDVGNSSRQLLTWPCSRPPSAPLRWHCRKRSRLLVLQYALKLWSRQTSCKYRKRTCMNPKWFHQYVQLTIYSLLVAWTCTKSCTAKCSISGHQIVYGREYWGNALPNERPVACGLEVAHTGYISRTYEDGEESCCMQICTFWWEEHRGMQETCSCEAIHPSDLDVVDYIHTGRNEVTHPLLFC